MHRKMLLPINAGSSVVSLEEISFPKGGGEVIMPYVSKCLTTVICVSGVGWVKSGHSSGTLGLEYHHKTFCGIGNNPISVSSDDELGFLIIVSKAL